MYMICEERFRCQRNRFDEEDLDVVNSKDILNGFQCEYEMYMNKLVYVHKYL